MVQVTENQRFSPGSHEQFSAEYLAEIRELATITALPVFDDLINNFTDYSAFLASKARTEDPLLPILTEAGVSREVYIYDSKDILRESLAMAHIAACCHLLHSSRLARANFLPENLLGLANQFLETCRNKDDEYRNRMVGKYHAMDTMRTIQLLRVLGLITTPSTGCYQLGLGAADGTRDVLSFHLMPGITITNEPGGPFYMLRAETREPANIVIVDADPIYKEQYAALNGDSTRSISAYNCDTMEALDLIQKQIPYKSNLVTGLRIDHRMLPDVETFFQKLTLCIDTECDMVMSIGAGDTIDAFEGRINKFKELFDALECAGMRPVLFKLHGEGDLDQQWNSLKIGNPRSSSYQILYCRINSKSLSEYYKN